MSSTSSIGSKSSLVEERRLWIGNLDSRISEYQLLKIVQKCGQIEKFDMIFHKSGPQAGQARGYAFVTYHDNSGAMMALSKLNGTLVGTKNVVVRLAKNINYDEMDKPKSKVEIPALAAGTLNSNKLSKELTIKAIEAKLKALENQSDDLVINQTSDREVPLIQKYQFNKNGDRATGTSTGNNKKFTTRPPSGPYNRNQRRHKR
ncbi:probable RNA-binding protein 18 [Sitodiplosis mosellana]|uniref:probable RNA-binding protein 18 n=1 Tax=Sitodiplosis mosellana TaxID=263140 RepID=UPI0024441942|nr:probable RNA-binding protein 18 [Sitodiplosis mosellana]